MARLGELLTQTRLIEPEKVEQALRAQVVWGGRLGTNLIELGCIELDELSRALGQQHGIPCAQARHFEKLVVPRDQKPDYLHQLRGMNVSANALFPGVDGLGRSLYELTKIACWRVP